MRTVPECGVDETSKGLSSASMTAPFSIIIPAAGASSRMRGGDKLMEDVDGKPCIAVMVVRALALSQDVIVAVPALDHPRAKALVGLPIQLVPVPDAAEGMSRSLQRAALLVPQSHGAMILPGDMPDLSGKDLTTVASEFSGDEIVRAAAADGTPGHPIIFPAAALLSFSALEGDRGAAPIVASGTYRVKKVQLESNAPILDLDTPEAWADFRQRMLKA